MWPGFVSHERWAKDSNVAVAMEHFVKIDCVSEVIFVVVVFIWNEYREFPKG